VVDLKLAHTPANPSVVRDVIYIGVGAATAYSLSVRNQEALASLSDSRLELEPGDDGHHAIAFQAGGSDKQPYAGKITIIGQSDAWEAAVRGSGDINHQHELIDHWGLDAPQYKHDTAKREDFARQNAGQVLQAARMGAETISNSVKAVKREDDGTFSVTLNDAASTVVRTQKLVVASGAGAHTQVGVDKPKDQLTKTEKSLQNNKINLPADLRHKAMDLDTFMRKADQAQKDEWKGKTIVVHGPNAGIDAVERAGQLGAEVKWVSRTTDPVLLDGNQLKHAPRVARDGVIKAYELSVSEGEDRRLKLDIGMFKTDGRNKVEKDAEGKEIKTTERKQITADLYVFALGQDTESTDAHSGEVGVGGFLKDLMPHLEPQYDINGAFGDKPYETVMGFQTKGSNADRGLEVIGAAASGIAKEIPHNYLDKSLASLSEAASKNLDESQSKLLMAALQAKDAVGALAVLEEARSQWAANPLGLDAQNQDVRDRALRHVEVSTARHFAAEEYFKATKGKPDPTKSSDPQINAVPKSQVSTVLQAAQLGAVKASVAALEAFIPGYVQAGQTNFSADNRQQLRVFIAQNFPNITNQQATTFINDLIVMRHQNDAGARKELAADLHGQIARDHAQLPLEPDQLAKRLVSGGIDGEKAVALAQALLTTPDALREIKAQPVSEPLDPDPVQAELQAFRAEADKAAIKEEHKDKTTAAPEEPKAKPARADTKAKLPAEVAVEKMAEAWRKVSSAGAGAAHGTPKLVRDAYLDELRRLDADAQAQAKPAVRAWVQV
jgi:hypothetical protein